MLQAIRNQSVAPPPATRAFAMAHVAGFNALNGISGGYQGSLSVGQGPKGADLHAAYAVAFSTALGAALNSSFSIDLHQFLATRPDGDPKDLGVKWGHQVALALIRSRIHDGAEPSRSAHYLGRYPRRQDNLKWSPTGPFYSAGGGPSFANFARGLLPGWGGVTPWSIPSASTFLALDFPEEGSAEFNRQLEKVRALGSAHSKVRSSDQRQIAFFWEDGPRGVTPPGHWQIIAMGLLQRKPMSLLSEARSFALLSSAQADAGIATWQSKYAHDVVRPETYIRKRAKDPTPGWQTLIPTPGFPSYTSGHSAFSASSARMLALLLGTDRVQFSSTSPDLVNWPHVLTDVRRSWSSLSQAAQEGGDSREYGGIHWEADNTAGLMAGRRIADHVFANSFRKVE
ncbi:vanadium-dependent haloperoxidase [Sulfitobacter sp.]|uniref:vanadium-dependent haloperoxidase n=1 Tax=Sulfitobacter sp. TaxID=1903071 RepID=UPI0030036BD1